MKDLLNKCKFVPRDGKGQGIKQLPSEKELIEALAHGKGVKGAAKLLGVCVESIRNYKNYYCIPSSRKYIKDVDLLLMAREYESGMTQRELSVKHGVSQTSISRALIAMGIKTRGKGQAKAVDKHSIWKLYSDGHCQESIAMELGCSQSHVSNVLNGRI